MNREPLPKSVVLKSYMYRSLFLASCIFACLWHVFLPLRKISRSSCEVVHQLSIHHPADECYCMCVFHRQRIFASVTLCFLLYTLLNLMKIFQKFFSFPDITLKREFTFPLSTSAPSCSHYVETGSSRSHVFLVHSPSPPPI